MRGRSWSRPSSIQVDKHCRMSMIYFKLHRISKIASNPTDMRGYRGKHCRGGGRDRGCALGRLRLFKMAGAKASPRGRSVGEKTLGWQVWQTAQSPEHQWFRGFSGSCHRAFRSPDYRNPSEDAVLLPRSGWHVPSPLREARASLKTFPPQQFIVLTPFMIQKGCTCLPRKPSTRGRPSYKS